MSDPLERLRAADPLRGGLPEPLQRIPAPREVPTRRRDRALVATSVALLATVLLHGLDHELVQQRGFGELRAGVILGGAMIAAVAALSLAAAWRGHRRAPLIALLSGPWVATVIVVGHFLPNWSDFTDSYADAGVGAESYVVAAAVVAAGLAVAAAALQASARRAY